MTRLLTFVCVGAVAAGAAGCQPPLKEYTSKEYKFQVKFPGTPDVKDRTTSGTKFKTFLTETGNGGNMVTVADLPLPEDLPPHILQDRLDGARDGAINGVGGKQLTSTSITLAGKYPGREFSASITQPMKGMMRARIWFVGTRLYQVMVIGADSYANSKDSTAFLDSFQLTE